MGAQPRRRNNGNNQKKEKAYSTDAEIRHPKHPNDDPVWPHERDLIKAIIAFLTIFTFTFTFAMCVVLYVPDDTTTRVRGPFFWRWLGFHDVGWKFTFHTSPFWMTPMSEYFHHSYRFSLVGTLTAILLAMKTIADRHGVTDLQSMLPPKTEHERTCAFGWMFLMGLVIVMVCDYRSSMSIHLVGFFICIPGAIIYQYCHWTMHAKYIQNQPDPCIICDPYQLDTFWKVCLLGTSSSLILLSLGFHGAITANCLYVCYESPELTWDYLQHTLSCWLSQGTFDRIWDTKFLSACFLMEWTAVGFILLYFLPYALCYL